MSESARRRVWKSVLGVLAVALALYLPHLNLDDLLSDTAFDVVRVVLATIGAALVIWTLVDLGTGAPHRGDAFLHLLAAALVLLAVYLPHLGIGDALDWLFNSPGVKRVEEADVASAISWLRFLLVVGAAGAVAAAGFRYVLESGLGVGLALVSVALLAVVGNVISALDTESADQKNKASFDRGFSLSPSKLRDVTRELAADRCVTVTLVFPVDAMPGDDKNVLAYRSQEYAARLVDKLKTGAPAAAAEVELAKQEQREEFARRLVASSAVYLHSTDAAQQADKTPAVCP